MFIPTLHLTQSENELALVKYFKATVAMAEVEDIYVTVGFDWPQMTWCANPESFM